MTKPTMQERESSRIASGDGFWSASRMAQLLAEHRERVLQPFEQLHDDWVRAARSRAALDPHYLACAEQLGDLLEQAREEQS